jgi:hypothetical protein
MTDSGNALKKYKYWLAIVFIVSFVVFLLANVVEALEMLKSLFAGGALDGGYFTKSESTTWVSMVSLLTSGASLIGFLVTTGISWRKERREGRHEDLDLEKKKLELEKLRLDIERMSQENASRAKGPSDVL